MCFDNTYRDTMQQLGMQLSHKDIADMMKSVGVEPHGKISYSGQSRLCVAIFDFKYLK